ncbi:MAG: hypothetical protein GIX03_07925 [Candidatus Eremiobacteraeota bacterium]|nr:hypothetical protein [Candidatus Eremiobacteraeota bacterium]MBC5802915.1 hypothetical protein [Candidatus Eremiobacteraeota bacterium]MBC5821464.1 hypothetical protein [Candidatus Eremiobacteraeota bacterium]
MRPSGDIPELAIVRIQSAGGPYRSGDVVSLAFAEPSVARVAPHDGGVAEWRAADPCLPEVVSAVVTTACRWYGADTELTLSFIDPCVARIHAADRRTSARELHEHGAACPDAWSALLRNGAASPGAEHDMASSAPNASDPAANSYAPATSPSLTSIARQVHDSGTTAAPDDNVEPTSDDNAAPLPYSNVAPKRDHNVVASPPGRSLTQTGALVRLQWTADRVRRFVSVVDRLFTVDRLGWYRHALAMRLLVPDEIVTFDERSRADIALQLHELRAAVAQTFGRPLLSVFMPNFNVDAEWLEMLDSPQAARALAALRDLLLALADDRPDAGATEPDWTVSPVLKRDLLVMPAASLEALLPILIPTTAPDPALGARLADYRRTLVEAFGQTVRSAGAVRLGAMTEPHHALDDRLWQLVGAVGTAFGEFASRPQPMSTPVAAEA